MGNEPSPERAADQRAVLEGLLRARWIERFAESKTGVMLQWTDEGLDKLTTLNALLVEIGAEDWTNNQRTLALAILYFSQLGPLDENNVTLLGSLFDPQPPP